MALYQPPNRYQEFLQCQLPEIKQGDNSKEICGILQPFLEHMFENIPILVITMNSGYQIRWSMNLKTEYLPSNSVLTWTRHVQIHNKYIIMFAFNTTQSTPKQCNLDIFKSLFHGQIIHHPNDLLHIKSQLQVVMGGLFSVIKYPNHPHINFEMQCRVENEYKYSVTLDGYTYVSFQTPTSPFVYKTPLLLVAGSCNSPSHAHAMKKINESQNSQYLPGVAKDLTNMEVFATKSPTSATTAVVLNKIECIIDEAMDHGYSTRQVFVNNKFSKSCTMYYSGHGSRWTGDWCFSDGTVGLADIVQIANNKVSQKHYRRLKIFIIMDCCKSGMWVDKLRYLVGKNELNKKLEICMAAGCAKNQSAMETADGGIFTRLILGLSKPADLNKFSQQPEPLCWTEIDVHGNNCLH